MGRVKFTGWLDSNLVEALQADADVFVLPSHAEGMAMAILEGLSHGLPVVTTPVGAHTEVIESEVSGIFVPPGDADALARALARLIDDKGLRQRLGAAARRTFEEEFDVRTYGQRLGRIHANLLEPRNITALGQELGP